ncbi:MAG: hypothetical protein ACOYNO_00785 [Saprospiraceae bacterium]
MVKNNEVWYSEQFVRECISKHRPCKGRKNTPIQPDKYHAPQFSSKKWKKGFSGISDEDTDFFPNKVAWL